MHIWNGNTALRELRLSDITDYKRWFTEETEWMNWDAPWEEWNEKDISDFLEWLEERAGNTSAIFYRLEIETSDGEHIGWVSAYDMDEDNEKLAVGIDVPPPLARKKGHGERAFGLFISYIFERTEKDIIYTQTWSGNISMIKLAEKTGFFECVRRKNIREVNGTLYDGLTFILPRDVFYRKHASVEITCD